MREFVAVALSRPVRSAALRASLLVGVILNLVNQGHALFAQSGEVDLLRGLLNFVVPYCVATYGGTSAALRTGAVRRTPQDPTAKEGSDH